MSFTARIAIQRPKKKALQVSAKPGTLRAKVRRAIVRAESGEYSILRHPGLPLLGVVPIAALRLLEKADKEAGRERRVKPIRMTEDEVVRFLRRWLANKRRRAARRAAASLPARERPGPEIIPADRERRARVSPPSHA